MTAVEVPLFAAAAADDLAPAPRWRGRRRPGDVGRGRLYEAQRMAQLRTPDLHLPSAGQVRSFVCEIEDDPWFRARMPAEQRALLEAGRYERVKVSINAADGGAWASVRRWEVRFRAGVPGSINWSWRARTVVHEMAHLLTDDGHGPAFAARLIEAAFRYLGPEYGEVLRDQFIADGVAVDWETFAVPPSLFLIDRYRAVPGDDVVDQNRRAQFAAVEAERASWVRARVAREATLFD